MTMHKEDMSSGSVIVLRERARSNARAAWYLAAFAFAMFLLALWKYRPA